MDYCTSCRRHLNGALVCPGCGAYAPDIAPAPIAVAPIAMAAPTWEFTAVPETPRVPDTWHDGAPPTDAGDTHADVDTGVDVEGAPSAPQGRAARRRQVARWKKNKRKAVLATAVALVGGGLTLASMDRQGSGGGRTQAATAPDTTGMGGIEDEADQYTPPSSSGSGDGSSDTGRARNTDTGAPQGRYPDGRPRTTLPLVERDSEASTQSTNTPSSRQAQSADQSSGGSGSGTSADTGVGSGADSGTGSDTATDGTTTPPATDDSTGSGTGSGTGDSASDGTGSTGSDSGTSDSGSDSSDSSSSSGLCLLVICIS
jgi:hypothetical protein